MISEMLNVAQCSEAQNRGGAHAALRFLSNLETASSPDSATPTSALQSVIDIGGFSPDESTSSSIQSFGFGLGKQLPFCSASVFPQTGLA